MRKILGQHANPGHTIEDMWFMKAAADLLNKPKRAEKSARIVKKALEIGWDEEFGGLLHFCGVNGGEPVGLSLETVGEPMSRQLSGRGDKLWRVHSEALYSSLLFYQLTGDPGFLQWHDRLFEYTFSVFPNRNEEIREWIQILRRHGQP